jgi:hypothetical protein
LDQFLAELESEGIRDSKGGFKVDAALARRKMSTYQLRDPAAYVLKLVQAAVAAKAPTLTVIAGRDELTMAFPCCCEELASPSIVGGAVLRVASLARSPLRHLAVCLNAACAIGASEIRWETPGGTLLMTADSVSQVAHSSEQLRLVVRRKRSLLKWFFGTLFVEELRSLSDHCLYAPLHLNIDGLDLERPVWCRFAGTVDNHLGLPASYFLKEKIIKEGSGLRVSFPPKDSYLISGGDRLLWGGGGEVLTRPKNTPISLLVEGWDGETPSLEVNAIVGIPPTVNGQGFWTAVIDGVSLAPVGTDDLGHPGARVVFDAADLTTDVSEFRLVNDDLLAAKLAWARGQVLGTTESVDRHELRQVLRVTQVDEAHLGATVEKVHRILQNHLIGPPQSVEELAFRHFANTSVHLAPNIPPAMLATVTKLHAQNMDKEEAIIAIYDDTVFRSGKEGFVITEHRVCWKSTLQPTDFLLWEEIPWLEPQLVNGKIVLRNWEISTPLERQVAPILHAFLIEAARLLSSPRDQFDQGQRAVIEIGLKTIGKAAKVRYHPYIPGPWKAELQKNFPAMSADGEIPLLAYDDTLMGKADNGWVATAQGLWWRNLGAEPRNLKWTDMAGQRITLIAGEIFLGNAEVSVHLQPLRQPMMNFFLAMARESTAGVRVQQTLKASNVDAL